MQATSLMRTTRASGRWVGITTLKRAEVPFKARCKSKRAVSPLRIGEEVNVLAMAPEDECESEMLVRVRWHGRSVAVPLSQLKPLGADQMTSQAVGDWHYWLARGYQF